MQAPTIQELKNVNALNALPDEHLQWILDRSVYQEYEEGALIAKFGDPAEVMWFCLEGKVTFYMNVNGHQVYYFTFENNSTTGGVGGLLPYSRMKTFPGYAYAAGQVKLLRMHKDHFHDLEQLNPDFIQRLIGYMTERARAFATTELQHEKVNALGNLAAGIAHELNNPAAAINSISIELTKRLNLNYELTEKLLKSKMNPQQIQHIKVLVQKKEKESSNKIKVSVMQRMENEDGLVAWLEKNNVPDNREVAETFSEFGFVTDELESLCKDVGTDAFSSILQWLENLLSSHKLLKDLDEASCRISNLVGAIKSHVHMDRSNDLQPTNIHKDIENTLTLLGHKIREKNIVVNKKFSEEVNLVPAYVGELNQVWTNIIDNALFAMEKNGVLAIETSLDNYKNVNISIIDNGPGIPKEIMSRIFDPFFTTKKMGDGSGIGLDIVSRIIKHHNGEVKVNSVPGRTEFVICIPFVQLKNENK